MVAKTDDTLADLSDEDLERARAAAALDVRHDPEARERLDDFELEIARRRVMADRDEAAAVEAERREAEEAERRRKAEQVARERRAVETKEELRVACEAFEEALEKLAESATLAAAAISEDGLAGRDAFGPAHFNDGYVVSRVGERVRGRLDAAGIGGLFGPLLPLYRESRLDQLV